jgi:predicted O-methyltransferase YrrM
MSTSALIESVLRNPREAIRKARARLLPGDAAAATAWAASVAVDPADVLGALDPLVWEEAQRFASDMRLHAARRLTQLREERGLSMGGSADYRILFFLVRHFQPCVVVETGVAMGYSTRAILAALRCNSRGGRLYSSDLPYARIDDAESLIAYLVEDELRDSAWTLYTDGDRRALPRIANVVEDRSVDLLHYDSDKSASGRDFAMRCLSRSLARDAVIVIDDCNDNLWFRDFATASGRPWKVFTYVEKWPKFIGVVGI